MSKRSELQITNNECELQLEEYQKMKYHSSCCRHTRRIVSNDTAVFNDIPMLSLVHALCECVSQCENTYTFPTDCSAINCDGTMLLTAGYISLSSINIIHKYHALLYSTSIMQLVNIKDIIQTRTNFKAMICMYVERMQYSNSMHDLKIALIDLKHYLELLE